MGKTLPVAAMIPSPAANDAQKGYQAIQTLVTANNMPSTTGPARPTPPMTLDDVRRKVQDAFTAAKVMKAVNNGDGSTALSAVNRR